MPAVKRVDRAEFDPDVMEANDEQSSLRRRAERAGRSLEDQRVHEEIAAKEREQLDGVAYLGRRAAASRLNPGSGWGASPDPMLEDRFL